MAEQKFNPKDLQIALKTFDYESVVQIKLAEEIDPIVAKNAKCVKLTEKRYYTVDVSDAMRKLTLCGDLIQLSYVSTDGFKAQAEVGKLLSNYSTLVKSSYIGACKFVEASISALGYHRLALELLKKKPNKSIVFLGKCGELAKEMAGVAAHLSSEAKKMVDIATGALTQAISDKSINVINYKAFKQAVSVQQKYEKNQLQRTLKSLETAIGTLGKIQVIFNNTRVFWEGVEANCKACSRIASDVKVFADFADDEDIQEEIKNEIVDSTLKWFVLAKVNFYVKKKMYNSNNSIVACIDKINSIQN
eukprot:453328_1